MSGLQGRRSFLAAITAVSVNVACVGRTSAANNCDGRTTNSCSRIAPSGPSRSTPPENKNVIDTRDISKSYSNVDGKTAFIVGGIHGDERAGIIAAKDIAGWTPDSGQLVVLPEANPMAIQRNTRENASGNLNRKFPVGSEPTSTLARSIWDAVTTVNPDLLITLHESKGILGGTPSGVGQRVFHRKTSATNNAAQMGIRRANKTIEKQRFQFDHGQISGPDQSPTGLLSGKAAYGAGIPSFIIETYEGVNEESRVQWQKTITRGILDYYDVYE